MTVSIKNLRQEDWELEGNLVETDPLYTLTHFQCKKVFLAPIKKFAVISLMILLTSLRSLDNIRWTKISQIILVIYRVKARVRVSTLATFTSLLLVAVSDKYS